MSKLNYTSSSSPQQHRFQPSLPPYNKKTLLITLSLLTVLLFFTFTLYNNNNNNYNNHNIVEKQELFSFDHQKQQKLLNNMNQQQQQKLQQQQQQQFNIDMMRDDFKNSQSSSSRSTADEQQQQPILLYILPKFNTIIDKNANRATTINELEGNRQVLDQYATEWTTTLEQKLNIRGVSVRSVSPRKALVTIPAEHAHQLAQIQSVLRGMVNVEHVERKPTYHTMNTWYKKIITFFRSNTTKKIFRDDDCRLSPS